MAKGNERSVNSQPDKDEKEKILLTVGQQRKLAEVLEVGVPDGPNDAKWQKKFVTAVINAVLEKGDIHGRGKIQEIAEELNIPLSEVLPTLNALVSGRLG